MTADSELHQTVTQEPSPAGTGNLTLHSEATFTPDEGSEGEARLKDSAHNEVKDSENKKDGTFSSRKSQCNGPCLTCWKLDLTQPG